MPGWAGSFGAVVVEFNLVLNASALRVSIIEEIYCRRLVLRASISIGQKALVIRLKGVLEAGRTGW